MQPRCLFIAAVFVLCNLTTFAAASPVVNAAVAESNKDEARGQTTIDKPSSIWDRLAEAQSAPTMFQSGEAVKRRYKHPHLKRSEVESISRLIRDLEETLRNNEEVQEEPSFYDDQLLEEQLLRGPPSMMAKRSPAWNWNKRKAGFNLSLTSNIDVLRERLLQELARRNHSNDNGLSSLGKRRK